MSGTNWTPGPWQANFSVTAGNQALHAHVVGPIDGSLSPVCEMADTPRSEIRSNAHLIAAAPELYDALESLLNDYELVAMECGGVAREYGETLTSYAAAALKKARGES